MARLALVAVLLFSVQGCNQHFSPVAETEDSDTRSQVSPEEQRLKLQDLGTLPDAVRTPDEVVEAFLVAVREGDNRTTASLLTDKARIETAKHDLVVEPPGTPSARFVVGDVQYIGPQKNGAHVNTVWTESDDVGETVTYDVVWALRRQTEGWRVAGIATEIVQGAAPIFLNFEEPTDMLEKWQRAEEIAARHQQSTMRQATPASSTIRR